MKRVQEVVKRIGFEKVYLRTEHTSHYYRKLGWEYIYKTNDEKGREIEIFSKSVVN
ncbi:GNAT family N-acetyltransferase [Alkaliphilus transvaalensis]|uniref:hypothetical protein n=1 Tax=Alkaliphilus transvaalensis TaxID=114628 RepID=UPI0038BB8193